MPALIQELPRESLSLPLITPHSSTSSFPSSFTILPLTPQTPTGPSLGSFTDVLTLPSHRVLSHWVGLSWLLSSLPFQGPVSIWRAALHLISDTSTQNAPAIGAIICAQWQPTSTHVWVMSEEMNNPKSECIPETERRTPWVAIFYTRHIFLKKKKWIGSS